VSTLNLLAIASFVFVVMFTWRAYVAHPSLGQSPRSAIIEAWINIGLGFGVNFVANVWLLPLVGAHFTHAENFALGWVYTAISIVRTYTIRRWFNARVHRAALLLTTR